jgi:uncharacterized protein YbjT (DUF2867 family)
VRAFDLDRPAARERAAAYEADGVPVSYGDFDDPSSVRAALEGADAAFLLVVSSPKQVERTRAFLEEAERAGVGHVVKLSALAADRGLGVRLHEWMREGDETLAASGMSYTILRPNSFMQNLARVDGHTIVNRDAIYAAAGDARIGFVDARDIAAVAAASLADPARHANRAYELTGPEALSYAEVAEKLSERLGRRIRYFAVSPEDARRGMAEAGLPGWEAEAIAELFAGFYAAGEADVVTDDVEEATGRRPRTIDEFIERNLAVFRR